MVNGFNATHIRCQTKANLLKWQTEPFKVSSPLLYYRLSLFCLCKDSPGAWMFHGHPAACFPLLRFSLCLSSPRKLKLHNCTHSHSATIIRQLFCLEDSIIPFSGISSSIIILIIAFDPKKWSDEFESDGYQFVCNKFLSFQKNLTSL